MSSKPYNELSIEAKDNVVPAERCCAAPSAMAAPRR